MKLAPNITHKLIAYLVVVGVLPLLVFAFTSYHLTRQAVLDLAGGYSAQLLANQREYLQLQLEQVENLAARIAGIEEISAMAVKVDATEQRNAYDELSTQGKIRESLNVYASLRGVVSIDMYTLKGHRFYVGDTLTVAPVSEATRLRLYRAGLASPRSVLWLGVQDNLNSLSGSVKVLTAVKIIRRYSAERQSSEPVGMLVIDYSTDFLAQHFSAVDLGRDAYLLASDADGRLIYAPQRQRIGTALPPQLQALVAARSEGAELRLDERAMLVRVSCLREPAWCVLGVIPQQTLLTPMVRLSALAALLMLGCFAVIAAASRLFQRSMVDPVRAISAGFRRIQERPTEPVAALPVPDSADEISELVAWFNAFLETLLARQHYEQQLARSEHKFSSIFQLSPIPLGMVRIENGEFVDVNDFWLSQFGYAREEVVGHTSAELRVWDDPQQRLLMLDQIHLQQLVLRQEVHHRTKDGRVLVCLLSGRPFDFNGEQTFIFSLVDITRQREVEREIREINQQLESRVLSRTLKLEQANLELEQAMVSLTRTKDELARSEKLAALGSLVAGVAHELNTPIGNSVTVASTLQDMSATMYQALVAGKVRRAAMDEYFNSVANGTELLARNLRNASELITSFKQVAADQASNQRRRYDLRETLDDVLATLLPMYRKSPYVLHCEVHDEIEMDSYPGPLGQVITNFVTNALAHAFEGRDQGRMVLRARRLDAASVEIIFSDDGVGIPEESQARVFDPFFTTKLGRGGSGLGLNIVYNIVTGVLGGMIRMESRMGEGTSFIVVVPLSPKARPQPALP